MNHDPHLPAGSAGLPSLLRTAATTLAAVAFAACSLLAQDGSLLPPVDVSRDVCTPIHALPDDDGGRYGLWAAGRDYKVAFADGMTFVPYLEAGAASAVTWRWNTVSARVGELELITQPPRLRHTAWRAEYALGGLVEAYDVRAEGVEQTFVLHDRPAAAGDLVLRGAVTSSLRASERHDRGGVTFVDALGVARVHYGDALAIDANGRRLPMQTCVVPGGIELRLAGSALAEAAFPLVVDPLVAPVVVAVGAPCVDVAVAYDQQGSKNLWLAEVRETAGDADLRLFRTDPDGANPVLVFADLSNLWSSREPSLGLDVPAGRMLLAWTRYFTANDTSRVRMHVHERADLGLAGGVLNAASIGNRNQWRPVVGDELSPVSFTSVLVAMQVEGENAFANLPFSEIHGQLVTLAGAGSIVANFPIADAPFVDHERPTLAKVAVGPTRQWTVAYQRYAGVAGDDWDVGVRRIDAANVVGPEVVIDGATPGSHEMAPRLGGSDDRLMLFTTASTVAESSGKPAGANGHRIRGTRLGWNGAFTTPHGSKTLQANADARLELAGVDFDRNSLSHWALAFRSNVTQNLYLRLYGYRGEEVLDHTIDSPATALGTIHGGSVCFRSSGSEFHVGYGIVDPGQNSPSKLRRRQYTAVFPAYLSGASCTPMQIAWNGSQWIGGEFGSISFTGSPAGTISFAVLATAPASLQLFGMVPVVDGCWQYVPIAGPDYLGELPWQFGTSGSWSLPIPEGLSPLTLYVQGVNYDPVTGVARTTNRLNLGLSW